ncbi:MAG: hypothetical protein KJ718_05330 [Nanoarchaeota archaeon]|nr:hypothetical protein [Nanoarchaeota archaeon]MBU1051944.1 hypothetical protein [Nanoarchaeota archaeon]MBU1988227.1 hypothetical protein [Nanoarchaeota archaeon]
MFLRRYQFELIGRDGGVEDTVKSFRPYSPGTVVERKRTFLRGLRWYRVSKSDEKNKQGRVTRLSEEEEQARAFNKLLSAPT